MCVCVCLSLSLQNISIVSAPPNSGIHIPHSCPMLSKSFQVPERHSTFVSVGHADKNYIVVVVVVVVCRRRDR